MPAPVRSRGTVGGAAAIVAAGIAGALMATAPAGAAPVGSTAAVASPAAAAPVGTAPGSPDDRRQAAQPRAGRTWSQVATAEDFSCGLSSGRVLCWGLGNHGQLGSRTGSAATPVATAGGAGRARQVTAGGWGGCLLTRGGAAYCWGINSFGEAGNGSRRELFAPTAVSTSGALAGTRLTTVSSGFHHTCALSDDGKAYCWGQGAGGQLGNGDTTDRTRPVAVDTSGALRSTRLAQLDAGDFSTCAVDVEGRALCWGTVVRLADVPTLVPLDGAQAGLGFRRVSVGGDTSMDFACAVGTDDRAYCWGTGLKGQLGNGSRGSSDTPVEVGTGQSFASVSAGGSHACGIDTDGRVWCWGDNAYGQLGTGNRRASLVPVRVSTSGALGTRRVAEVSSGYRHTCAVTASGSAACWGAGVNGELGNGRRSGSRTPVAVR